MSENDYRIKVLLTQIDPLDLLIIVWVNLVLMFLPELVEVVVLRNCLETSDLVGLWSRALLISLHNGKADGNCKKASTSLFVRWHLRLSIKRTVHRSSKIRTQA